LVVAVLLPAEHGLGVRRGLICAFWFSRVCGFKSFWCLVVLLEASARVRRAPAPFRALFGFLASAVRRPAGHGWGARRGLVCRCVLGRTRPPVGRETATTNKRCYQTNNYAPKPHEYAPTPSKNKKNKTTEDHMCVTMKPHPNARTAATSRTARPARTPRNTRRRHTKMRGHPKNKHRHLPKPENHEMQNFGKPFVHNPKHTDQTNYTACPNHAPPAGAPPTPTSAVIARKRADGPRRSADLPAKPWKT
jgi:hypothetical protein